MKSYKRLTYKDRLLIEKLLNNKVSKKRIAELLNVHLSAIYYEIKKGQYTKLKTDLTTKISYSADISQNKTKYNLTNKGKPIKLQNNYELAKFIESKILQGYSPDVVTYMINTTKMFGVTICTTTLYNWIDKGVFLNISNNDLLYKKNKKIKNIHKINRERKKGLKNRKITDRNNIINNRLEFGHWEMDTVISKKNGKNQCLLVLTERKTRYEIIRKIRGKNVNCVALELFKFERKLKGKFNKVFKSITCDNGCEFLNQSLLEKSCYKKSNKTILYYCNPYSSWERGSNEKQNQIIRRFIPKGILFEKYTNKQIKDIQNWINTMPRKRLNYNTSFDLFKQFIIKYNLPCDIF